MFFPPAASQQAPATIAGAFWGGLALALLLSGWLGLVPYSLMAAGYYSSRL
jgi:hypothetical protein